MDYSQNFGESVEASNSENSSNSRENAQNIVNSYSSRSTVLGDVVLNSIEPPPPLPSPHLDCGHSSTSASVSTDHQIPPIDLSQIHPPPRTPLQQIGGCCFSGIEWTTGSLTFSRNPKRPKYAKCEDEIKRAPLTNLNLGGQFLFGFPAVDCLNIALSFLCPEELARNQRVSKKAEIRFKKAFEFCETYSTYYTWKKYDFDESNSLWKVQHAQSVAKYCKRLKKVDINLYGHVDRSRKLILDCCREILEKNKQICTLHLSEVSTSLLATISPCSFPLRELTFEFETFLNSTDSPFDPNLLASSGHKLQILNLGLADANLNLHDLIQYLPNLEVFGLPRSGVIDELRTTPADRLRNLTELTVRNNTMIKGVGELMRRAPNLEKLRVISFDYTLVDILKCFSGESLSLGFAAAGCMELGPMFGILRRNGVALTHLRRFSTQRFIISPNCDNFVEVAPNVNVILADSAYLPSLEALHTGNIRITCLLLKKCKKRVVNFLARKDVFPELKHVSTELGLLKDQKNRKSRVVEVPFRSHFSFRLSDRYGDCGRMMDCEEFE